MARPWDYIPSSAEDRARHAASLTDAEAYGKPRKVWVEDGHVFIEGHDGKTLSMTPEVAIDWSRSIGEAGAESLVNRVMAEAAAAEAAKLRPPASPE